METPAGFCCRRFYSGTTVNSLEASLLFCRPRRVSLVAARSCRCACVVLRPPVWYSGAAGVVSLRIFGRDRAVKRAPATSATTGISAGELSPVWEMFPAAAVVRCGHGCGSGLICGLLVRRGAAFPLPGVTNVMLFCSVSCTVGTRRYRWWLKIINGCLVWTGRRLIRNGADQAASGGSVRRPCLRALEPVSRISSDGCAVGAGRCDL